MEYFFPQSPVKFPAFFYPALAAYSFPLWKKISLLLFIMFKFQLAFFQPTSVHSYNIKNGNI